MKWWFFTSIYSKGDQRRTVNLEIKAVGIRNAYAFFNSDAAIHANDGWMLLSNSVSEGAFVS